MKNTILMVLCTLLFSACIGDDIIMDRVDETLRITSQASSIAAGETFQFEARFTNNIGVTEEGRVAWQSSNEDVLTINQNGLATAIAGGSTTITAEATLEDGSVLTQEMQVEVSMVTVEVEAPASRSGVIRTTTFYDLEGDFTITEDDNTLTIEIAENYLASSGLPGLYIYLTNNPNSISDALEIGAVEVFQGAHSYEIQGVSLTDYDYVLYFCKPFRVKVGDGKIN